MESDSNKQDKQVTYAQEAALLRAIWDATPSKLSQAEFGETFNVGGQSAVNNFLKGSSPLSLKAAMGFSRGLGVPIDDFSPRLAAQAKDIAATVDRPDADADLPRFSRLPSTGKQGAPAAPVARAKKYLVAVHDPETEEQVGMVLLEAASMSDAHDRGLRLIQQHQARKSIDIEHFITAVFEVYSLRPAHWD